MISNFVVWSRALSFQKEITTKAAKKKKKPRRLALVIHLSFRRKENSPYCQDLFNFSEKLEP